MILNWKSENTIELISKDVVSEHSVGVNDVIIRADYGPDVSMDIVFGEYNVGSQSFTEITAPLPTIAEARPDESGLLQWRAKIPATVLASHGKKGLVIHAKIPAGDGLFTRVTSPIFKFTVVESLLGEEYNLTTSQYDSLAAALSALSATAVKNINNKTGNIVKLTGDDIKVDEESRTIQDALNYLYAHINANKPLTFIQILNVNNLDNIQAQCTAAVLNVKNRAPENGDYCMVNVEDVSFWYIYNSATMQWEQTEPQSNAPMAQNGVQGTVEGSWTEVASLQRALMVKITNGDFEGIFIKDSATGMVHSLPVLLLDINDKLDKLLDGNIAAPKAVADEDGNTIKETYRTIESSYNKDEVYKKSETYSKEEADSKFQPKGLFKNLYITSEGFKESLPDLIEPQFSKTVASVSTQLIFDIASDLNLSIEFSNNDILLLHLHMAFSVVNPFTLTARMYVKKGDNKIYIGTYTKNTTPITAGAGYPIHSYSDMRIFLNEIPEGAVVSLTPEDKIGLELYLQFESSVSTGVRIYSNGLYPSYIEAQANHIKIDTAQLNDGSVTSNKIADGAVIPDKLDPTLLEAVNQGASALSIAQTAQGTAENAYNAATQALASATSAVDTADAAISAIAGKLDKSGGAMTGPLYLADDHPKQPNEAVPKSYADALAVGLQIKDPVRLATTVNITLAGLQVIDGVQTTSGDRILVKDQLDKAQNGIYYAAAGGWGRTQDALTAEQLNRAYVYVENGATQGGYSYALGVVTGEIGTTDLIWRVFAKTVPIKVTAGEGVIVNEPAANRYEVGLSDGGVTDEKLAENAVTTEKLAENSVTTEKLAENAVTTNKITDEAITADKLAENAVTPEKLQDGAVTGMKLANKAVTPAKTTFMPAANPSNNRLLAADGNGNIKDSGYSVQPGDTLTVDPLTVPTSEQVSKRTEELQTNIEESQSEIENLQNATGELQADLNAVNTKVMALEKPDGINKLIDTATTKLNLHYIPDTVLGQVEYKGTWNAATNTPTLPETPPEKGVYYVVNTAGKQFGISFNVGDWIISNGEAWEKVDNTDAVTSVNGKVGAVELTPEDIEDIARLSYVDLKISEMHSHFVGISQFNALKDLVDTIITTRDVTLFEGTHNFIKDGDFYPSNFEFEIGSTYALEIELFNNIETVIFTFVPGSLGSMQLSFVSLRNVLTGSTSLDVGFLRVYANRITTGSTATIELYHGNDTISRYELSRLSLKRVVKLR